MIVMYWNVRGFGISDTKVSLKNLYVSHKPVFIFLAEPMISFSLVPSWYWHGIEVTKRFLNDICHLLPKLWALGGDEVNAIIIVSNQCIAIKVHHNFTLIFMRTGVVYLGLDFRQRTLFSLFFSFVCYFFLFFSEGFGLVPPSCNFPLFLIKFETGDIGWEFIGVPT